MRVAVPRGAARTNTRDMTDSEGFGRFFLPGPTEVRPEVLAAMERPVIGHRGPAISELIGSMRKPLSELFQTERPVYLSTSSATGMMEAAITNLSRRRVLCLVCGAFSARFHKIAEGHGVAADRLDVEWGSPNLPDALHEKLAEEPGRYDLVTVVHSETSTGVLNPIAEISRVVHDHEGMLLAVDTVSSLAGTPVRTDEWELDFVLTGAQKAVAIPPGIALAVASERSLERAARVERRGFYFDLLKFEASIEKRQTPSTPAVSIFYSLARQLERIFAEGLQERWDRHRRMAERTYAWVAELAAETGLDVGILAPAGYRSPTLTVVTLPDGLTGPQVVGAMGELGFSIAPGYGRLKERAIRIGHMGDHTLPDLEALLDALSRVLTR